jgi:hypothetical protein
LHKDKQAHGKNVGFGGSNGTYHVNTGLAWKFAQSWPATLYGDYIKHDYENSSPGSSSWYLYDAAEYGLGVNIMYHFQSLRCTEKRQLNTSNCLFYAVLSVFSQ